MSRHTTMLRAALALLAWGVAIPSCACAGPGISVDLRTDLVPSREFVRVQTSLASDTMSDDDAGATRDVAHNVSSSLDYLAGVRVAEFANVHAGDYLLDVSLLDAQSRVLATRRVAVAAHGHTAVTVVVTRNCVNIACPPNENPSLTACFDDECVDPRCSPQQPSFCPPTSCTVDADCIPEGCGRSICAEGHCLTAPDDHQCAAGYVCWSDLTCIPSPVDGDAGESPFPDLDGGIPGGCVGCAGETDPDDDSAGSPQVSDGIRGGIVAGGTYSASSDDPCRTLHPTIRGTSGPDTIQGTPQRDVIFAGAGDDTIFGNGGDDVICAGGGEDHVEGGDGRDYIDGGFGSDVINAGPGDDIVHGRSGGDTIHGQEGDDRIFGDLLDDQLFGDNGDDYVVGGQGNDAMDGGAGDDWLRGDTNEDSFVGGSDSNGDTASFATATPPGQPLGMVAATSGVILNVQDLAMGWASGDGFSETVTTTERFIGSAFDDLVTTGVGVTYVETGFGNDVLSGPGTFVAAPGRDTCNGGGCPYAADGPGDAIVVFTWGDARDAGLGVIGSSHADTIGISINGKTARIEAAGATLVAGSGCVSAGAGVITCSMSSVISFVMAYGGAGDDQIHLDGRFPRDMDATIDGGDGDDILDGHDGQDILFAGPTGMDQLNGLSGDDALISESQDRDQFSAGDGNDQLVTNWPCGNHEYVGGPGMDVAGFARVGDFATAAERARQSIHATIGGSAFQPSFCAESSGTNVHFDCEVLEGAGGDDVLNGFDGDHDEIFWGRAGNDQIQGYAGDDVIEGHADDDEIHGGPGLDRMRGGGGNDVVYAADGEADLEITVSSPGCVFDRDPVDPQDAPLCH